MRVTIHAGVFSVAFVLLYAGLAAGLTACAQIAILPNVVQLPAEATPAANLPAYDRNDWGRWTDADDDCQDTRQEVLIEESLQPVEYETDKECRVESGEWTGPFTGETFTDPGRLHIDHTVPLKNAHRSGAANWSAKRKRAYFNDLRYAGHLVAVKGLANSEKGARGPDQWKPPNREHWCEYATRWAHIKLEWELTATKSELDALKEMLQTCAQQIELELTMPRLTLLPLALAALVLTSCAEPPTVTYIFNADGTVDTRIVITLKGQLTDEHMGVLADQFSTRVAGPSTPTAGTPTSGTPTPADSEDALALYDDNGNGRITCAEARRHGIAPVERGHPAYEFMRYGDGDGMVCE